MELTHKGYRIVSNGISSISIYNSENREVYHTASRSFTDTEVNLRKCIDFYLALSGDEDGKALSDNK